MPSPELVAAVARIKADGARRSPAEVLTQLQGSPEWMDVTISQVRRAITKAPKADAEVLASRRSDKKAEHESKRDRTKRTRPAEEQAQQEREDHKLNGLTAEQIAVGRAHWRGLLLRARIHCSAARNAR